MSNARNLARLLPSSSGLIPDANLAALSATKLTGKIPGTNFPTGSAVQTVTVTKSNTWSGGGDGSTFYAVAGLTVSITPVFSNSIIVIRGMATIGSGYWEIQGRILRNGNTWVGLGDARGSRSRVTFLDNRYEAANGVRNSWGSVSYEAFDVPGSTSTQSYQLYLNGYSSYTVGINYNPYTDSDSSDYFGSPISTITATEIAA